MPNDVAADASPSPTSTTLSTTVNYPITDIYNARIFAIRELRDYTQHLAGSILRLVDMLGLGEKQAKAMRDLVFRECWDEHYNRALNWAEDEAELESREGRPAQEWRDVDVFRAMHPMSPPEFNRFPFGTYPTPQPGSIVSSGGTVD